MVLVAIGFGRRVARATGAGALFSSGKWEHILFTHRRRPLFECPALCAGANTGTDTDAYASSHPGTDTDAYPKTYAGAHSV